MGLADDRWWVLRHRLHHRFTDTESDPYSAVKGLFYSHVGWIFVKEEYPALKLVDKSDLDGDLVVRFQHRWFVILASMGGLLLPAIMGHFWFGSWKLGIIWGGIIARIAIWHCTYLPFHRFSLMMQVFNQFTCSLHWRAVLYNRSHRSG